ncbi:EutN/CcmL family microcompartment protein, partial [Escherichia coli]|uniref:EutN/CcmL family microcompartment protein n=1 Tax=Escherichia coli TaxID=562 RepID=UPI0024E0B6B6
MHLARVTGAVVSTQKSPSLTGKKLLLVRRVMAYGEPPPTPLTGSDVAGESVGACVSAVPTTLDDASLHAYGMRNPVEKKKKKK